MTPRHQPQRGTVVLVALCFVAVLGIALATYLALCLQAMTLSNRSYNVGVSEQLAETGLEQAMWDLNNNPTFSGWTLSGTTATQTITFGSAKYGNVGVSGTINLRVDNYNVRSVASAWNSGSNYSLNAVVSYKGTWYRSIFAGANTNHVPPNATYWASAPVIYAEGVASLPDVAGTTLKTQLRATVAYAPLFPNAAAATVALKFSAGGLVDSYDSTLGTYASQTPGFAAVVAGGSTSSTAVTLTSARVNGYAAAPSASSSPYAPLASFGTSAIVSGTSAASPSPKVDLDRVSRSPYIPQFDINIPGSSGTTALPGGTATLGTAGATTPTVYYYNGNLSITDSRVYTIDGPVRMVINGYFYLSLYGGSAGIVINNNSSAALELFVVGDLALYGNGIDNRTKSPKRLSILGTTSATATDMSTTTDFYGVLYLPNAKFTVQGSQNLYGAFLTKNLTFAASPNLHYDTSLRTVAFAGADAPCIITEWRELTDPTERVAF